MLGRFVILSAWCFCVPMVLADLTFDLVPVDNSGVLPGDDPLAPDFNDGSYFTFDLLVIVTRTPAGALDDWVITEATASISGAAEFFQHPAGGETPRAKARSISTRRWNSIVSSAPRPGQPPCS